MSWPTAATRPTAFKVKCSGGSEVKYFRCEGIPVCCEKCFEQAIIACAWCGLDIYPGSPVTLYSPVDKGNFQKPERAAFYDKEKMILVGCLRWACADTGADRAGFWTHEKKVERMMSPLEACLARGEAVVVEDLGCINEAQALSEETLARQNREDSS